MGKHIHLFNTQSEFEEAYNGNKYIEPWVSYTEEVEKVNYNKSEREKLLETPLTFEIQTNGNIYWKVSASDVAALTIQYSKNGGEWTEITATTEGATIPVVGGDIIQFRGDNTTYMVDTDYWEYNSFSDSTAQFKVKGNIMSLINSTEFETLKTFPPDAYGSFCHLFNGCTDLTDASELVLPATALTQSCYECMFYDCISLTTAPELPATTLANGCYFYMFYGCTSLTTAPALPATTLADGCYECMFEGCSSITTSPSLPATTLASYCYEYMFAGCTSLITAPSLPATTLADSCYQSMFTGCTSLTTAPSLPATTLANSCYSYMFYKCTSLTTAPALPATALTQSCYSGMFNGCTSLSYIKCLATNISASNCTSYWVQNIASSGTFITPSSTQWGTGTSGIPTGWTRVNA